MRRILFVLCISAACFCHEAKAQWVVTDPGNLAQGIINSAKQIIQTSTTANNTLNGFKETAKVFEQGKKYYDALKSVHNLVKDARKVQQTVLLVGGYFGNVCDELSEDAIRPEFYTGGTERHRFRIYEVAGRKQRTVGGTENGSQRKRAVDERQGTYGRDRPGVQGCEGLPQSGGVLHEPEHLGFLPACEREK